MSVLNNMPMFFLGANSPKGFVSSFGESFNAHDGWRAYILKGGPGTGKSTVMKKIAVEFKSENCHLCPCSSDPNSLDGVILHDRKTVILDGTSPHIVEPIFPGACEEIVNLGECLDSVSLRKMREEIIEINHQNSEFHKRASRYISVAGGLISDTYFTAEKYTNIKKCRKYGEKLVSKFAPSSGEKPILWVRYLSGITPLGHVFYKKTLKKMCDTTVVISDDYGVASSIILECAEKKLLDKGHEVISCRCPMNTSKREHLIVPALRLCFVTENRFHPIDTGERIIHARRFLDMPKIREEKSRINYNRRTAAELMLSAREALAEAKEVHDRLESKYTASMNYDKLAEIGENLYKKILS